MSDPILEAHNLSRNFGDFVAVDEVNFTLNPGEIVGFLGPNGAGKTTTIKMLTGLLGPSSGTARVAGFDMAQSPLEAKARIGYLPEGAPAYGEMTAAGFLDFIADVRGIPRARRAAPSRSSRPDAPAAVRPRSARR